MPGFSEIAAPRPCSLPACQSGIRSSTIPAVELTIKWEACRLSEELDEEDEFDEGIIEIDATIHTGGRRVGITDGFYLCTHEPWSPRAYVEHWDADAWTCRCFEDLMNEERSRFREPLQRLVDDSSGILCIRLIALDEDHRRRGLGREVLRQWLATWCDFRIGAVIIHTGLLQHRHAGAEEYRDELRGLPEIDPAAGSAKLAGHFRSWGFHAIAGTPYMAASPEWLGMEGACEWPPPALVDDFYRAEDDEFLP